MVQREYAKRPVKLIVGEIEDENAHVVRSIWWRRIPAIERMTVGASVVSSVRLDEVHELCGRNAGQYASFMKEWQGAVRRAIRGPITPSVLITLGK